MRVGIIAIQHESNTFLSSHTTIDNFQQDLICTGDQISTAFAGAHHEVGGMLHGLADEKIECVPIFAARAVPSGVITAEAAEMLVDRMLSEFDRRGGARLDGLLVAPHGAAVAESRRDFDGYWLSLLRSRMGNRPIVCTLDLHANVSRAMVDACDATIGYRTNPHLDQRQRGDEAARLIARTLRGEIRPTQAMAAPPVAINIERQLTEESPCKPLFALADEQLRREQRLLSNSVLLGFPYADVPEMGTSVIAVTNDDPLLAQHMANELAGYILDNRRQFVGEMIHVNTAMELINVGAKPVCLLDTGDNVGGGSPADGTLLAIELHQRRIERSLVMICDPASADQARRAGIGASLHLTIGGKSDLLHGPPLAALCSVIAIGDGLWRESEVRHGGHSQGDMGQTTVVKTDGGVTIALTSRRQPPFTLAPFRACGLDPAQFDVHVAKGVHAPVAAYREVCRRFIRVNTPGVTNADMTQLSFHNRRRPMFPFEEVV